MNNLPDLSALAVQDKPEQEIDELDKTPPTENLPDLSDEEANLRIALQLYNHHFKEKLNVLSSEFKKIGEKNYADLIKLQDQADRLIGSSAAIESKKYLLNLCVYGVEKFLTVSGFACSGLTRILQNDQGFQDNLLRIALKQLSLKGSTAEMDAIQQLASTIVSINLAQTVDEEAKSIEKQIPKSIECPGVKISQINMKYADL